MAKKFLKKVAKWGGVDVTRYDKKIEVYLKLFEKYQQFTMVPRESFIENLALCNHYKNIKGDLVECGVWRGGMSAAISEILGESRRVHLFDSFEGLPPAKEIDGREAIAWQMDTSSKGYYDNCTADEQSAIDAMIIAKHENYTIYKGWFDKTLPGSVIGPIGILRLDGDWYDSILVCLQHLFPKISEGGIVILDDYYTWDGCAKAVHDYLSNIKSPSRVYQWHDSVAYIVKKN